MKKLFFVLLFAGLAATAAAQVKFTSEPTDTVREMAVKQGKLVFIDLYADWCPPCRVMEKQVFSRSDVGDFMNERFVSVKYDIDQRTGKEFMEKYNLDGIPTFLIFNTKGELLGRIVGASDAPQFMADVQKIIDGQEPKK